MRISDWSSDVFSSDLMIEPGVDGVDIDSVPRPARHRVEVARDGRERERVRAAMMAIQRCDLARGHQIGIAPGGGHHHDVGLPAIAAEIADIGDAEHVAVALIRSEEHTSELQSLMRISYAVFCLKKKNTKKYNI